MRLEEEIEAVRRHLEELASRTDQELVDRYELRRPTIPPGLYWQVRWFAGCILRSLRSIIVWHTDSWPVSLKGEAANAKAKPLLIWAVGADRGTLRDACGGFSKFLETLTGFAPVLITDIADFALFSRLGWLVEYVPQLAGLGEPYEERKVRFLARLYRGAPALPLHAGLEMDSLADDIGRYLHAR